MTQVKIRFFGPIRSLVEKKEQFLEMPTGATIRELLDQLKKTNKPDFERYVVIQGNTVNPVLLISLNGESLDELNNIDAKLPSESTLDVMLVAPIVGG